MDATWLEKNRDDILSRSWDQYPLSLAERAAMMVIDMEGRVLAMANYPVSYTHLDVYKRQAQHLPQKEDQPHGRRGRYQRVPHERPRHPENGQGRGPLQLLSLIHI